ncbi:MAG: amino acid ABC transporter substrate-binding protein [Firmicutes bacterium]|nr:amino acid ABC transporter substrate-binding protein [Bacillota bacterium]
MKKKLLAIALVLVFAFAMTACGSSSDSGDNSAGGTLVMATNATFPPYEFVDGDDYSGIDVEMAQAIAEKLGLELEIQDIDFNSIITAVESGKADVGIAGMTKTEEREKNVNFSEPYAKAVQVIVVNEGSKITGPDDLADAMIGVQDSTTGHIYCEEDYGEDHVTAYPSGPNAIEALKSGKVDAVVIDNEPAKAYVAANEGLKILDTEYVEEEYAIAIAKDNEELLEQVNGALAELNEDGTLQGIIDKYIKAE